MRIVASRERRRAQGQCQLCGRVGQMALSANKRRSERKNAPPFNGGLHHIPVVQAALWSANRQAGYSKFRPVRKLSLWAANWWTAAARWSEEQ